MIVGSRPVAASMPIEPVHPGELDLAAIDLALSGVPVLGRSSR